VIRSYKAIIFPLICQYLDKKSSGSSCDEPLVKSFHPNRVWALIPTSFLQELDDFGVNRVGCCAQRSVLPFRFAAQHGCSSRTMAIY